MTCLIFVCKVGKLGGNNLDKLQGGMWLWGADQLVLWLFYDEKPFGNILSYMWPLWRHGATNIGVKLGFHWQMTHVEYATDIVE